MVGSWYDDISRREQEKGGGGGIMPRTPSCVPRTRWNAQGGTFLERKHEYGCAFGECPSNLSENEIVNDDGVSTSDAESQEALVADDETDSSLGIVNEAEIEEGVEEGMSEVDGNDGELQGGGDIRLNY
jgi:hypothetical protein